VLFGAGFERTNDADAVTALRFISASGGIPPGEETAVLTKKDIKETAESVLGQLKDLTAAYDDPATPYPSFRRQKFDYRFDDYAHLARVAEWSGTETDGGET